LVKLPDILDHTLNKDRQYVVQKYIENPLLIKSRKFDIRQWVLIRNYNPPKVWFYEECYLRFCTEEYNTENVANKFVHLTNNAIQKHSPEFNNTDIEGNMWTMGEFEKYLEDTYRDAEKSEQ
jgi:tubulin monoglycylase TTLL3/8